MPVADLRSAGSLLVHKLGGIWYGNYGMCLCPAHPDRSPSLSVRLGDKALLFTCFAGCDRRDVIRALRKLDLNALDAARPDKAVIACDGRQDSWLRRRAEELWRCSVPLRGTQAEAYLQRRSLFALPEALRFCGAAPLGRGREVHYRPALVAAVQDGKRLLAVQRTYLEWGHPRRARDLGNPRRMLGRPYGGAVRLADPSSVLGLAEGIETAVSAMVILGLPVWATLGSKRLSAISLPPGVDHLILLPDRDAAGRAGATRALEAYASTLRRVDVLWPPMGFKDWNDVLRMGGKGGGMGGARWAEWLARCRQELKPYV